ncbi:MAG: hypothetical protein ACI8ZO_001032 [Flavobacteriales bacterium]
MPAQKTRKIKYMRKIILIVCLAFIASICQAQQWFDLGVKYGLSMSQLTNKNIFNDKSINQELDLAHSFGGKFGFNFHEFHEITIDYMSSNMNFAYTYFNESPTESKELTLISNEIQLFYRHNKNGTYFEIGPSITTIKSAKSSLFNADGGKIGSSEDAMEFFETKYPSAVIGFGGYIFGTENTGLTLGFRFAYSWKDVISEVGGKDQSTYYPANASSTNPIVYDDYSGTYPFSALLVAEINFDFAYIARASCSRAKLVLF